MYKCPQCGSTDLRVECTVFLKLDQTIPTWPVSVFGDVNEYLERSREGSSLPQWDDISFMLCRACGHAEQAWTFQVKEG